MKLELARRVRAGDEFGEWALVRRIGGGGNGQVWLCRNGQGEEAAIKLLRPDRRGRMRLARFRHEIAFLLQHGTEHPGILPILDHDLSEEGGVPWFVMPLAQTLPAALGDDPEIGVVIEAVASFAGTLASLHEHGVGHRDIKPDNLFGRDGRWLVGDFGLVTYPEKDALTEHGRRLTKPGRSQRRWVRSRVVGRTVASTPIVR